MIANIKTFFFSYTHALDKEARVCIIGDDISIKGSNVEININNICNLINRIKRAI
jgi:hypothetical protein